jgi:uncharacterized membrane protein YcaP (DUF421 family)
MPVIYPYLIICLRSICIYLFIVIAIRLFGKKELSQLSITDLVFILLISNSVQNAMVGTDTSLMGGIVAALGLFICNAIFRYFLLKSKKFSEAMEGEKIVLVVNGKLLKKGLEQAKMNREEVEMVVREHGVQEIADADLVAWKLMATLVCYLTTTTKKQFTAAKSPNSLTIRNPHQLLT